MDRLVIQVLRDVFAEDTAITEFCNVMDEAKKRDHCVLCG